MFGGFDEATTPFIRITATYPPSLEHLTEITEDRQFAPYRLIPQLMASSPERLTSVAEKLLREFPYVELNCGCPSPKVYSHRAGSQLLADADYFFSFIHECSKRLGPEKLAVKIRLGIDQHSEIFDLLKNIGVLSLNKLTIHGRTKVQGYGGSANWGVIDYAARNLDFPVVGSGDISDRASFLRCTSDNAIDSVIIGRGALKNPWVFKEIKTGVTDAKSRELIALALTTFYLLHYARAAGQRARDYRGAFKYSDAANADMWLHNVRQLQKSCGAHLPECRIALGRLKMLWTYLKSTLCCEPQAAARCLRSRTVADFFEVFNQLTLRTSARTDEYGPMNPCLNHVKMGEILKGVRHGSP